MKKGQRNQYSNVTEDAKCFLLDRHNAPTSLSLPAHMEHVAFKGAKTSILGGTVITVLLSLSLVPAGYIKQKILQGFSTSDRYEWRWKAYAEIYSESTIAQELFGKGLLIDRGPFPHDQLRIGFS